MSAHKPAAMALDPGGWAVVVIAQPNSQNPVIGGFIAE
jgi:hypothetical protein